MTGHSIVWFRHDLRIRDNPALAAAARAGRPVIPVFIHCPEEEGSWPPGAASNWWLHHALAELREELERLGLPLVLQRGPSLDTLEGLIDKHAVEAVYWNRRYEPAVIERDASVERALQRRGVSTETFNASLLFEPQTVNNRSGQPFRVFTPFWKHLYGLPVEGPVDVDTAKLQGPACAVQSVHLEALELLPRIAWDAEFHDHWSPGIEDANDALENFVEDRVCRYRDHRDFPAKRGTSRLSPYLRFGQLGPRQVWHAVEAAGAAGNKGGYTFLSEIAWREFAYHLIWHFPETPEQALSPAYRNFPWQPNHGHLEAWQQGMTGYPIVDAGMRQLWRTGWMHNRVRMITASFLVKHLLQPWQEGARWFWDTLVDADLASNTMGWQWTAGCGADAAPYFRIFNPMLQGAKFDPDGDYVRRWVPELRAMPDRFIHQPWEAPSTVLKDAGLRLGEHYPEPVIGHREGRERALAALAENKARNAAAI